MKIIKMSCRRVYGFTLFGKFITIFKGKELLNNNLYGWSIPPKLKDCPVCWGGKRLFYRKDGKDVGIKDCYFCKGIGKIEENDKRNPFLIEESKSLF